MVNSPELVEYLRKHEGEYGLFVFIPYMFGTTYYGARACPEKSVLIPCLHEESYAYMGCFREAYASVRGMIFHAEPERRQAERLFGVRGDAFVTLGEGVDTDWTPDAERFRQKFGIRDPFVLYAGRKDAGKRTNLLISYFNEYKRRHPGNLRLVLIGGGKVDLPAGGDVLDLGFVETQDKYDAYGAAELFCNPSETESFSLVVMESWLAQTPVLVNGKCAVTRDFACAARGGLYFEDFPEFEQCVKYLTEKRDAAGKMGRNGRRFVMERFGWNVIVKKYGEYFRMLGE